MKRTLDPKNFLKPITDIPGCQYLEHEELELFGYKIFGTPYVPPISDWAFMLKNDERKAKFGERARIRGNARRRKLSKQRVRVNCFKMISDLRSAHIRLS